MPPELLPNTDGTRDGILSLSLLVWSQAHASLWAIATGHCFHARRKRYETGRETHALHRRQRSQTSAGSSCLRLVSTDVRHGVFGVFFAFAVNMFCALFMTKRWWKAACHLKLCLQMHLTKSLCTSGEKDEGRRGFSESSGEDKREWETEIWNERPRGEESSLNIHLQPNSLHDSRIEPRLEWSSITQRRTLWFFFLPRWWRRCTTYPNINAKKPID